MFNRIILDDGTTHPFWMNYRDIFVPKPTDEHIGPRWFLADTKNSLYCMDVWCQDSNHYYGRYTTGGIYCVWYIMTHIFDNEDDGKNYINRKKECCYDTCYLHDGWLQNFRELLE
jgi:hypothetical protein